MSVCACIVYARKYDFCYNVCAFVSIHASFCFLFSFSFFLRFTYLPMCVCVMFVSVCVCLSGNVDRIMVFLISFDSEKRAVYFKMICLLRYFIIPLETRNIFPGSKKEDGLPTETGFVN